MSNDTKIIWNESAISQIQKRFMQKSIIMAGDIARTARNRAPYVTGNLESTIRVEPGNWSVAVIAGGKIGRANYMVDYAYKREIGPNRFQSTEHYMQRSLFDITTGNWQQKYFGGIA